MREFLATSQYLIFLGPLPTRKRRARALVGDDNL
jgi:hypothetical protein